MGLTGSQQQQLPNQAQTPKDKKKNKQKVTIKEKKEEPSWEENEIFSFLWQLV